MFSAWKSHIFCMFMTQKDGSFIGPKMPLDSDVRGPNHWAIFAPEKCLSKEILSLANPGRGVPIPAGAFSASKIAYPMFPFPK